MLTPKHFEYQAPADADHLWVETLLFPVVIPEEHIYALVYTNVRPAFGVMWNQVMISGCLTDTRAELLHYAENPYLLAPERFTEIDSPLGLKISAVDLPRRFRVDYEAEDGTEIHVNWDGLMDPFDIHDPDHSPQAGSAFDIHTDLEHGVHQQVGHGDMTGRITGTLTVRGRTFEVDSVERMDRSWGRRDPMKAGKPCHIVSANFGEDLAFHMICPWDPTRVGPGAFTLTHGYILENGEVYGLTDELEMESYGQGFISQGIKMTVTDVRGNKHTLTATPDVGAPWVAAPTALVHNAMMRWDYEGREGYGVVMRTFFLPDLNRQYGRFYNEPASPIVI